MTASSACESEVRTIKEKEEEKRGGASLVDRLGALVDRQRIKCRKFAGTFFDKPIKVRGSNQVSNLRLTNMPKCILFLNKS